MPKSLGQIHTVSFNVERSELTGPTRAELVDVSGLLSTQYNRNIRMMQNYKLVGLDMVLQLPDSGFDADTVMCKGRIRYIQPTKGRCEALRQAYQQVRAQMKNQGIDPSKNHQYDFRVLPRGEGNYQNSADIFNISTLDGTTKLALTDNGGAEFEVFGAYNENVRPANTGVDFSSGLKNQTTNQTDFVLNQGLIHEGNADLADEEFEEIPFVLSYDSTARRMEQLNWRPDPALYVSCLTGHLEVIFDEITVTGGGILPGIEYDLSVHIAGWKSMVRPPKQISRNKKKK